MKNEEKLEGNKPTSLASLVDYSPNSVISRSIMKNEAGTVTLFAFAKGEGLSPHSAPYDAMVHILDGEAQITIDKEKQTVRNGEMIIMPANIPHAVQAEQCFKMMLVMIKGQPT